MTATKLNILNMPLVSGDGYNLEEPRKCRMKRRVSYKKRDDFALVDVDPPILYRDKIEGDLFLSEVIITSRHAGFSIFEFLEWPLPVHVLRLKKSFVPDYTNIILKDSDFESIAWAELHPTEESARFDKI